PAACGVRAHPNPRGGAGTTYDRRARPRRPRRLTGPGSCPTLLLPHGRSAPTPPQAHRAAMPDRTRVFDPTERGRAADGLTNGPVQRLAAGGPSGEEAEAVLGRLAGAGLFTGRRQPPAGGEPGRPRDAGAVARNAEARYRALVE